MYNFNYELRRIVLGIGTIILIAMLVVLLVPPAGGQEGETLTPSDNPHDNPHCDPRGSMTSVRCGCAGMVHQVEQAIVKKCWGLVGVDEPDELILRFPPPMVQECLEQEDLAHCQIVARSTWQNENDWGIEVKKPDHECKTTCRPDRCGCSDGACPMHGETELY